MYWCCHNLFTSFGLLDNDLVQWGSFNKNAHNNTWKTRHRTYSYGSRKKVAYVKQT